MKNGKCIYCKSETKLNKEDAFPQSLRQPNTPKWIIDNHLCKKCNSQFGNELDVILSRRSPVGFIFDIIQRELGNINAGLHSSPYHKPSKDGVKPIRLLFPNPVYNDLFVLHEPDCVNHQLNYMGVRALQPQMILTQYPQGQTSEDVVEENNRKYNTRSIRTGKWYTYDEIDDVFCLFENTYIFTPKTAERFFGKTEEFKSKYITNHPNTLYDLQVISPEVGRGEQKFFDFFNAIEGDKKEMIPEDKNLPVEVFRNPITVIMDKKGRSYFYRSIAKLAFHCLLYHYPEYSGFETMFNGVKNYISRGSGRAEWFIGGAIRNEIISNIVYEDEEHQHFFSYFIKDNNIGCQIDLFTGITAPHLSYGIVLAGDKDKIPLNTRCVKTYPFYVNVKSFLKKTDERNKMNGSGGNRIVSSKNTGIIRPSNWGDLLWLSPLLYFYPTDCIIFFFETILDIIMN